MSAAPIIESVKPSRHFMAILDALVNASNDEYETRLAEVLDYVAACENNANITALQSSIVWNLRTQEHQKKKLRASVKQLTRFEPKSDGVMEMNDLGTYVSFYAVMETLR